MKALHRLFFLITVASSPVIAGLGATEPATVFSVYAPGSVLTVDHGSWDVLLGRYLVTGHPSGVNLFNYAAVTPADRALLSSYLAGLRNVNTDALERDEQMAFWINLYNALTVQVILDHYPVESIRDISLPGSRGGPWKADLVQVNGIDLSLDDIEHGILRPIWKDRRIHYAVNCASFGCPNLASRAYTGAGLEMMLEEAARSYINHPRGVDLDGRRLLLSSIYSWYAEDFGDRESLIGHLLTYAEPAAARRITESTGAPRYRYDWSLNAP